MAHCPAAASRRKAPRHIQAWPENVSRLSEPRARSERIAAQERLRRHRSAPRPLQPLQPQRAFATCDGEAIVEEFARLAGSCDDIAVENLETLVAIKTPSAGMR